MNHNFYKETDIDSYLNILKGACTVKLM